MKNLKLKKFMSLFLSAVMLISMIVSSSALNLPTFTGTIISENNIDLSGIEVKIYSSEPVYDEEGDLLYYAEMYEMSVLTNSDGEFEFIKPSVYCSYTVNIKTLPVGYGISKHTQFVVPSRIADTITVAPVATAETTLDGDNIIATFFDANGNTLYTDYEVVPDESISSDIENMGNISTSEMIMSYSALKALDSYTYSGTIVTSGKNFRYSKEYDLSGFSEINKADVLYYKGKISEKQKYDFYIEYLNDNTAEKNACSNYIINELIDYSGFSSLPEAYSLHHTRSLNTTYPISSNIDIIFSMSSFLNYNDELMDFFGDVESISSYFCDENGFLYPEGVNGSTLEIYITSDISEDGRTYSLGDGGSEIHIKESLVKNGTAAEAMAHEFMHAIMNKYGVFGAPEWFDESFVSMASLVYMSETENEYLNTSVGFNWFRQAIAGYINYSYQSLYSSASSFFNYGALVYPLCFYEKHGNWVTIKNIFEEYDEESEIWDCLQGSYMGEQFDYKSVFSEMAISNYLPTTNTFGYNCVYGNYIETAWPKASAIEFDISTGVSSYVAPMGNKYYSCSANHNIGTLYITCESDYAITFSIVKNKIVDYELCTNGVSRITFEIDNFGNTSSNDEIAIIVTNTYTSGNQKIFSIITSNG